MAEAASSPGKVMLKRKTGGLMTYPWQNNWLQPSPLARTLAGMVVAVQVPQDTHASDHSYFRIFMQF